MRVSIRFSETKDRDIIDYLNNCKDKTKGIKTAMRGGLIPSAKTETLELIQKKNVKSKKVDILSNLIKSTKDFNK